MTHDELLAKIDEELKIAEFEDICGDGGHPPTHRALRAAVELHKPQEITLPDGEWGANCIECDGYDYPCPTIQAIEKELR